MVRFPRPNSTISSLANGTFDSVDFKGWGEDVRDPCRVQMEFPRHIPGALLIHSRHDIACTLWCVSRNVSFPGLF